MRTKIPKEYFSMFSWFNKQPQEELPNYQSKVFGAGSIILGATKEQDSYGLA